MGIEVCMRSEKRHLPVGIALMLASALLTCCGQLCWKLSARGGSPLFLLAGFGLNGCGAPVSYTHLTLPTILLV